MLCRPVVTMSAKAASAATNRCKRVGRMVRKEYVRLRTLSSRSRPAAWPLDEVSGKAHSNAIG
jgi:hypothetical protein